MPKPKWTRIEDVILGKNTNKKINLRGWIYRTRSSGNIVFMIIRDAGGILQATIKKGNGIKFLWQHIHIRPIGVPVELREDGKGLYTKAQIGMETSIRERSYSENFSREVDATVEKL